LKYEEGYSFLLEVLEDCYSEVLKNKTQLNKEVYFVLKHLIKCLGNYKEELLHVHNWLQKRKFSAIGETGLDLFWDRTFTDQQYESFKLQIEWALQFNLPIVIHTRDAMQETIDVVKKFTARGLRGIFHCFSGTYKNAIDIINAGFLLGIGGVVTYKNAGVAEAIKEIDLAHIVLETDAPYLTPVPFRGKRNESSYIKYVMKKLAEIKNISEEEIAEITTINAERVFSAS
ncbi:MAG: TatD family hydrolase, partial [Ginsengibacter sp.]